MDIQSGYLEVNGAKLYYEEAGQGFPVILVHAGIADRRMWDDQFPVLAQSYRTIRYDMRGFGKSKMPPGPFSLPEDLYEVMQQLNIPRALLVGCSMGGSAIIDFAVTHPEMAAALVPVGAGLSGFKYPGEKLAIFDEMEAAYQSGDLNRVNELEIHVWVDSLQRTPEQVDQKIREKVREMNLIALETPGDLGEPQPLDPPALQRLDQLQMPMLVMVGELDLPNIQEIADVLATLVPHAKKEVITGTAHLPNMEKPDLFNQLVLAFFKAIDTQG